MDDFPPIFSAFLPANDLQGEDDNIWAQLFYEDSIPPHDAFQFGRCAASASPSARYGGDPERTAREGEGNDKKCLHRETERQRRNHMKSRYAQLLSLLPHSNSRGKASIADQLSEAIEYIRHLQEEVHELAKKRDDMKMRVNVAQRKKDENGILCEAFPVVTVNHVGSRVVVTVNNFRGQMVLSKLLLAVEEESLQLLSASSFFTNDTVFHTLHCKVVDPNSFGSCAQLKLKLSLLI